MAPSIFLYMKMSQMPKPEFMFAKQKKAQIFLIFPPKCMLFFVPLVVR